jgi:hypothetical protein
VRFVKGSGRTKVVYGVFVGTFAIGLALILALLVSFTGVWRDAPMPQITTLIVGVALVMVVLRLALAWSMWADGR